MPNFPACFTPYFTKVAALLLLVGATSLTVDEAWAEPPCPQGADCMYGPGKHILLVIAKGKDPAYVYFYVTGVYKVFNIRQGARQWEIDTREVTAVPRGGADGARVMVQGCLPGMVGGLFESKCGSWNEFILVVPRTKDCRAYADKAMTAVAEYKKGNCGKTVERWSDKQDHHFNWCMGLAANDLGFMQSETAARAQGLKDCAAQKNTAGGFKPKPRDDIVLVAPTFAGTWDSVTGDGIKYTLTLNDQGDGSVGAVDPKLSGTVNGTLGADGRSMSFVMSQPGAGITSRGQLGLTGAGNSFDGRITKDTDGISRDWKGTRRK